jgi:hypothetical protein
VGGDYRSTLAKDWGDEEEGAAQAGGVSFTRRQLHEEVLELVVQQGGTWQHVVKVRMSTVGLVFQWVGRPTRSWRKGHNEGPRRSL